MAEFMTLAGNPKAAISATQKVCFLSEILSEVIRAPPFVPKASVAIMAHGTSVVARRLAMYLRFGDARSVHTHAGPRSNLGFTTASITALATR